MIEVVKRDGEIAEFNLSKITEAIKKAFKATAKEPFARFQTVDEFIDAFDKENIQEELVTVGKYYAWVYREKDVTEQFEKVNKADIIYPIHVQN